MVNGSTRPPWGSGDSVHDKVFPPGRRPPFVKLVADGPSRRQEVCDFLGYRLGISLWHKEDTSVFRCNTPGSRPTTPGFVQKLEVVDIMSHKDPATLGSKQHLFVVVGTVETSLAGGFYRVAHQSEAISDNTRNVMVKVEISHSEFQRSRPSFWCEISLGGVGCGCSTIPTPPEAYCHDR